MNNKEILSNAPEGATHYVLENGTSFHFKITDKEAAIWTDEWDCYTPDLVGLRSLADIREIEQLKAESEELSDELSLAIETIEDCGVDWDEIKEQGE